MFQNMYRLLPDELLMKQDLSKAWVYSSEITIRFGTPNLIEVPSISRDTLIHLRYVLLDITRKASQRRESSSLGA